MRTLTTVFLTLLLAATAQAKGVTAAQACGPDGCTKVEVDGATMLGGASAKPPAQAEPFVRLRVKFGHPGPRETVLFLPGSGIMRFENDPYGQWVHMDTAAPYRAAAAKIAPFPAAELPASLISPAKTPPPAPSATAATDDPAFPWWIVVAAVGLLALLGTAMRSKVYGLAGAALAGRGTGRARP
jgi:hypothetical protein